MIKNFYLTFFSFLLLFNGCISDDLSESINGAWSAISIQNNEKEIINDLYSNVIIFKSDSTCSLPLRTSGVLTSVGHYKTIYRDGTLVKIEITCEDDFFNQTYNVMKKVYFYPPDGKEKYLNEMILTNTDLIIHLKGRYKGF